MAHKYDYPAGGKGDTRIPSEIPEEELTRRWEETFGKPKRTKKEGAKDG